jgi:hypothetical protein
LAVLIGWRAATRRGWRMLPAICAACLLGLLPGLMLAQLDWFATSIVVGVRWPPDAPIHSSYLIGGDDAWRRSLQSWLATTPAVVAIVAVVCVLAKWDGVRIAAGFTTLLAFGAAMTPALRMLNRLLTPEPIPSVEARHVRSKRRVHGLVAHLTL